MQHRGIPPLIDPRRTGLAVVWVFWLLSTVSVEAIAQADSDRLVELLRTGGYNLYFRHAATDWSQQDRVEQRDDWLSCDGNRIRQLSERGRETAQTVGLAMRRLAIPVSEVLASPYCRTMETARLLGLGEVEPSTAVMNLRAADYFRGRAAIIATARALLASPPPGDGNRVIVAHGNVAREATPVYPNEAEAVVFRPDGNGGFTVVGRVSPSDWQAWTRALSARQGGL